MSVLIFHSPMPIERPLDSGSAVRPKRMLDAFRSIGQEVLVVDGDSRRRRDRWRQAMTLPPDRIHGIYSELSTTPIALTDPDHLPRAPFMDFRMFRELRRRGVPVAAFYRDAYWRFKGRSASLATWKRSLLAAFHHLEWRQIGRSLDHCFVPSMEMLGHLPPLAGPAVSALPPAGVPADRGPRPARADRPLRLLYVGGVHPPDYDLSAMFAAVDGLDGVELIVCARESEWLRATGLYSVPANASITHRAGEGVADLYRECDAAIDWRPANDYLSFAFPVKTFEALGWGLPLIANGRLPTGRLALQHGFGWGPEDPQSLRATLEAIVEDPAMLDAAEHHALLARAANTWEARARSVLDTLSSIRDSKR
jgi:glycosyltransferase involved in cell wall biosynthesis